MADRTGSTVSNAMMVVAGLLLGFIIGYMNQPVPPKVSFNYYPPSEAAIKIDTSGVKLGKAWVIRCLHVDVNKQVIEPYYKPDGCDCGLPPWELCKPDCVHALDPATPIEMMEIQSTEHLRSLL